MEQIEIYHNQNRIQKEIISLFRMFKNDKRAILRAENKGLMIYTPKLNKLRVAVAVAFYGVLMLIPFFPDYLFLTKTLRFALK